MSHVFYPYNFPFLTLQRLQLPVDLPSLPSKITASEVLEASRPCRTGQRVLVPSGYVKIAIEHGHL